MRKLHYKIRAYTRVPSERKEEDAGKKKQETRSDLKPEGRAGLGVRTSEAFGKDLVRSHRRDTR